MKHLILCFLLLVGITVQAQKLMPFQDTNGKYGYKDVNGKIVITPQYDFASDFSEGVAKVKQNWKLGYIDKTGKEIIKLQYDDATDFLEGLAAVSQNFKWSFIDKTGKEIIKTQYDGAWGFHEGLARVNTGGLVNSKYGFIDKTGKEVIKPQYDGAGDFQEGLAPVNKGGIWEGKWGYIDKTGKEIIKIQYETAYGFKNNKALVILNGRNFYIDKTGKEISSNPQSATTKTNNKIASTSTTLSPNFLNQFKAILTANWEDIMGKGISEMYYKFGHEVKYESTKKIDGFVVSGLDYANGSYDFGMEVTAMLTKPDPFAPQLFDQISTQLEQLKNEGYVLISFNIPNEDELKSISINKEYKELGYISSVSISLLKNNYIKITFDKYQEYISTLSPNFYKQFKAILNASWEEVRDSLYDSKDNKNGTKSLYYTSKKSLDRFLIEATEDNKGNNRCVQIYLTKNYPNVHLYSLISTEWNKFKNEGYKVSQSEGDDAGLPGAMKRMGIFKGEKLLAEADLTKDSSIVILVSFPTSSPAPTPQKPKNLTRFQDENTQKWGYKDEWGNIIVQPIFDFGHDFWNDMALVNTGGVWGEKGFSGGKWGYIDNTGKVAIEPKYDDAGYFTEEVAKAKLNNKWGFIDKTGKIVIAFQYDDVKSFKEGLGGIKLNNKWGFIDKTGKIIINPIYEGVGDFSKGVAFAEQYGKTIFINKNGVEIDKTNPSATTTTNNKTTTPSTTTLSLNFLKQFKAIMTAKWGDVKGDFFQEKNGIMAYFCKKPLDNFSISAVEGIGSTLLPFFVCQDIGGFKSVEDAKAKNYGVKIVIAAPKQKTNGVNDVLFTKIKNELLHLQLYEGYTVLEHHFSFIKDARKAISLVKNNLLYATVILNTNGNLQILFPY